MTSTSIPLPPQFADAGQQREANSLGIWLFLLTEVMLFGGMFTVYAVYRHSHPDSFVAGSRHLDIWLGTINTMILITSSLTMALAHHAAVQDHRGPLIVCLLLTILFGATFLGIKSLEYAHKYEEQLVPGSHFVWKEEAGEGQVTGASSPEHVQLFFALYFVMTGLHAAHMVVGLGIIGGLSVGAWRRLRVSTAVEMTGLYWHFVDIVWIFLFPLLYLLGRH